MNLRSDPEFNNDVHNWTPRLCVRKARMFFGMTIRDLSHAIGFSDQRIRQCERPELYGKQDVYTRGVIEIYFLERFHGYGYPDDAVAEMFSSNIEAARFQDCR